VSLSLAGGASAATAPAIAPDVASKDVVTNHEFALTEEEVTDVSLGTFFVFDKEGRGTPAPARNTPAAAAAAAAEARRLPRLRRRQRLRRQRLRRRLPMRRRWLRLRLHMRLLPVLGTLHHHVLADTDSSS
jgi:hypothetical protein